MTTRIICVGNTTLDKVWPVPQLPTTGGKYRATDYFEVGGGMAATAAVAAARLGAHASYWGRAGDDTPGNTMKHELAAYGVDVSHFRLFPGARSSTSAILVSADGERAIINFRGAGVPDAADWLPLEQIREADAVHGDVRWVDGVCAAFAAARATAIPTVLDGEIAGDAAFAALLPLTDHAIFSEGGLQAFHGMAIDAEADRLAALHRVRTLGCRVAAVTRGAGGTVWMDESGVHFQAAFSVDVVDTTGAGDVFHGAYAVALGEHAGVPEAMRFASAVAALKCMRPGGRAGIPRRPELNAFLAGQQDPLRQR